MDGVVIYVSKDRSRAIVWCSDHGPLGLARRDAMPPASQPPLVVGEVVRFDAIDDAGMRLCGRLTRVAAPPVAGVGGCPAQGCAGRATAAPHLTVVPPAATPGASRNSGRGQAWFDARVRATAPLNVRPHARTTACTTPCRGPHGPGTRPASGAGAEPVGADRAGHQHLHCRRRPGGADRPRPRRSGPHGRAAGGPGAGRGG
jgi:hypothetical protein